MSRSSVFSALFIATGSAASVFDCSAGSGTVVVQSDFSYGFIYGNQEWLTGGDVSVYYNGSYVSRSNGGLKPSTAGNIQGSDLFGSFTGYSIDWTDNLSRLNVRTSFKCYATPNAAPFISFQTVHNSGCREDCTTTNEPDAEWYCSDGFNASMLPITHFPSWAADNGTFLQSGALSHIEWGGVFAWGDINFGPGLQPLVLPGHGGSTHSHSPGNGTGVKYMGGQMGGPVVLHDSVWSGSKPRAVHVTPLELFKHSMLALVHMQDTGWRWVYGLQGHLTTVPAGTSTSVGFFPSDDGITSAVLSAGQVLQAAYNNTRLPLEADLGSSHVAIYTDNGALYEWGYWTQDAVKKQTAPGQTVLPSLWSSVAVAGSMQLDPWMYLPEGTNEPFGYNWTLNPFVFGPQGLQPLVQQGLKFTYYTSYWSAPGTVQMPPFTFLPSNDNSQSQVAANESLAFYRMLRQRAEQWGGLIGWEQDFTDRIFMKYPDAQSSIGVFEQWLDGLDQAMADAPPSGSPVPLQICMGLASDALHSLTMKAATTFRASQDDDFAYAPQSRWNIGVSSLLLASLGLKPFWDVTWTTAYQNPGGLNPFGKEFWFNHTELGVMLSLLSTGPVGVGDAVGLSNHTLIGTTCDGKGRLLKPGTPLAALDGFFGKQGWGQYTAMVAASYSYLACSTCTTRNTSAAPHVNLMVVDSSQPVVVRPGDFTPDLDKALAESQGQFTGYVAVPWSPGLDAVARTCCDGCPVAPCAVPFSSSQPLRVLTGVPRPPPPGSPWAKAAGNHSHEVYTLHPVSAAGFSLLGELGKVARVSPMRFPSVDYTGSSLHLEQASLVATIACAAGEALTVTVLLPGGTIAATTLTCPSQGGTLTLTCTVTACAGR